LVLSFTLVYRLDRDEYYVAFGGNKPVVSTNGSILVIAWLGHNGIYEFDVRLLTKCMLEAAVSEDLKLWHMRFGEEKYQNFEISCTQKLLAGIFSLF
jgi:hypothetical protein